jgi:hypothetical protein
MMGDIITLRMTRTITEQYDVPCYTYQESVKQDVVNPTPNTDVNLIHQWMSYRWVNDRFHHKYIMKTIVSESDTFKCHETPRDAITYYSIEQCRFFNDFQIPDGELPSSQAEFERHFKIAMDALSGGE